MCSHRMCIDKRLLHLQDVVACGLVVLGRVLAFMFPMAL